MAIDFLGDLLGKARRRELEGAVRLNLTALGKRVGVGLAAAAVAAKVAPDLVTTQHGLVSLAAIGLLAAIPAGAASAGLITPAQPGSPSVAEAVVQSVVNIAQAPADKRQAAEAATAAQIQASVEAGLQKAAPELLTKAAAALNTEILNKTGQWERASAEGSPVLTNAPETPTEGETAIAAEGTAPGLADKSTNPAVAESQDPAIAESTDPAVRETGGNQ